VDNQGRPLFINATDTATGTIGSLIGMDVLKTKALAQATPSNPPLFGIMGDWSMAAWGMVSAIDITLLTEATIPVSGGDPIYLASQNMVAYRAEAEFAFNYADIAAFKKLVGATTTQG
jgi:HK97 family phage major capsid protein